MASTPLRGEQVLALAELARAVLATTLTTLTSPVEHGSRRNAAAAVHADALRARQRADASMAAQQQLARAGRPADAS